MNLIIDVGNTQVKLAVFEVNELRHVEIIDHDNLEKSSKHLCKKFGCENAIISNVGPVSNSMINSLNKIVPLIVLNSNTPVPFKNCYESPETLGVDRIALATSAYVQFSDTNVLVIDAGSCITYDFMNSQGAYLGGSISPGLQMRYNALSDYTKQLPLLTPIYLKDTIGKSTNSSIHIGVVKGVISEIDSCIKKYRKKNKNLTVVLTGGDVNYLGKRLKNGIFANPNFLLEGLNIILTHNYRING